MIINPSPFFGIHAPEFLYAGPPPRDARPWMSCICLCGKTLSVVMAAPMAAPPADTMMKVDLRASRIHDKDVVVTIWQGTCERCQRWYWTCDKFDWVTWLSDLQSVQMLMSAIPLPHITYDGAGKDYVSIDIFQGVRRL